MRLEGKTALVTAAGQGIGYASVIQMAREGATVYATDVNPKLLVNYSGVANVHPRILDVLDDAAVAKMIDELPALDVLFNCAGYVHHGTVLECTPKDWDFSFNLNVRAMYVAIRAAVPKMLEEHQKTGSWASIINMASVAGSIKGLPNRFVYGASKAAVVGLTKAVAADYRPEGHPLQRDRARARWTRRRWPTASTPSTIRSRRARCSSHASRWDGWPRPRRSRPSWSFSPPTNPRFATGQIFSVDGGMTI